MFKEKINAALPLISKINRPIVSKMINTNDLRSAQKRLGELGLGTINKGGHIYTLGKCANIGHYVDTHPKEVIAIIASTVVIGSVTYIYYKDPVRSKIREVTKEIKRKQKEEQNESAILWIYSTLTYIS